MIVFPLKLAKLQMLFEVTFASFNSVLTKKGVFNKNARFSLTG